MINKSLIRVILARFNKACGRDTITVSQRTKVTNTQTDTADTLEKVLSVYGLENSDKKTILSLTSRLEQSLKEEDFEKLELIKSELERYNKHKLDLDEELGLVFSSMTQNPLEAFIQFLLKLLGLAEIPDPEPKPLPTPEPEPLPTPEPSRDNCRVDAPLSSEGTGPHPVTKMSLVETLTLPV